MPILLHIATWSIPTEITSANVMENYRVPTLRLSIDDRLGMLIRALDVASSVLKRPEKLPSEFTDYLRIFLAPEYYFAAAPDRHLVPYEESRRLLQRLQDISLSAGKDWLLVPGTIAYYKSFAKTQPEKALDQITRRYKFLAVVNEGLRKKTRTDKLHIAHNTAFFFMNGRKVFRYRKRNDLNEVSPTESHLPDDQHANVLFAAGAAYGIYKTETKPPLTIGIEICGDHDARELEKTGIPIDIELLPHAIVTVRRNETAIKPGGYLVEASGGDRHQFQTKSMVWRKEAKDGLKQLDGESLTLVKPLHTEGDYKDLKSALETGQSKIKEDLAREILTKQTDIGYASAKQKMLQKIKRVKEVEGGHMQLFELSIG